MVIIIVINDQVKGEVYLVDDAMLGQLDILEDHPTYYRCINNIIPPTTDASPLSSLNLRHVSSIGSMIMTSIPKKAPVNKLLLKGDKPINKLF